MRLPRHLAALAIAAAAVLALAGPTLAANPTQMPSPGSCWVASDGSSGCTVMDPGAGGGLSSPGGAPGAPGADTSTPPAPPASTPAPCGPNNVTNAHCDPIPVDPLPVCAVAPDGASTCVPWQPGSGSSQPGAGAPTPPIDTPEQALAAVVAANPRFTGISLLAVGQIGLDRWAEATALDSAPAWVVRVVVGWGDCQAGCINRHEWTFTVARDGTVAAGTETGPRIPDGVGGGAIIAPAPAAGAASGAALGSGQEPAPAASAQADQAAVFTAPAASAAGPAAPERATSAPPGSPDPALSAALVTALVIVGVAAGLLLARRRRAA